ncbi:MAG: AI-2E family transporter [Minisyncoccia bacterium]
MIRELFRDVQSNRIVQAMAVALVALAAWEFRLILALAFFAFTLAAALAPVTSHLGRRMPRVLAVLIPYIVILALIGGGGYLLSGTVTAQLKDVATTLPHDVDQLLGNIAPSLKTKDIGEAIKQYVSNVGNFGNLLTIPEALAEGLVEFLAVLVMSIYLLIDRDRWFAHMATRTRAVAEDLEHTLGNWVRGQIALSVAVGLLVAIGLFIIGVSYAPVIGIISAFFEFIPYVGPILAGAVGVILAANQSLPTAGLALIVFILVQQLEAHVLAPQIMRYSVEVNPVAVILAVLAGFQFGSILGAVIAVPLVSTATLLWRHDMHAKSD